MSIRLPTGVEVRLLNDWAYYRDLYSRGSTLLQLETSWGSGWWELVVRLLGGGLRMTAERSERCQTSGDLHG